MISQKEAVLAYLKSGKSLTGLEALQKFGTMKLSTRVSELRQEGYDILHQMVNRNDKWVAKYFMLTPKNIDRCGMMNKCNDGEGCFDCDVTK